uniref:Uncharacterized protein n=1 Tax=Physcomitrium patens TaxID=3218 RepID=A0A2K1KAI8_PHYPA|nr:hypothetical protein PHYPA_009981 [Physcomitrium patens]
MITLFYQASIYRRLPVDTSLIPTCTCAVRSRSRKYKAKPSSLSVHISMRSVCTASIPWVVLARLLHSGLRIFTSFIWHNFNTSILFSFFRKSSSSLVRSGHIS